MYTTKGKVKLIGNTERISDSFQKRRLILETKEEYPQTVEIEFTQDRVVKLDRIKSGEEIEVSWFLKGREWTNPKDGQVKYFNTLNGWEVYTKLDQAKNIIDKAIPEDDDDLPF